MFHQFEQGTPVMRRVSMLSVAVLVSAMAVLLPVSANADTTMITAVLTATDKTYNGSDVAAATCAFEPADQAIITGNGDTVTCIVVSANFFTSAAGGGDQTVTAVVDLGGEDEALYDLTSYSITDQAAINKATLTPVFTADDKPYDGTNSATGTCSVADDSDYVPEDDVTCSETSASFANSLPGTGKEVTASGIALGGMDSSNYELSTTTDTDDANIDKATLTVTAVDKTTTYGSDHPALTYTITGYATGEDEGDLSQSPTCDTVYEIGAPAGDYDIVCSGAAADNYVFSYFDGTLTVDPLELNPSDAYYTGQTFYYTRSSSDTSTKVILTASIETTVLGDCSYGGTIADATVTFKDLVSGKILASGVPVTQVGENCGDGIASAFATLSTGKDYVSQYVIQVIVGGSFEGDNTYQLDEISGDPDSATVTVIVPTTLGSHISGSGDLNYKEATVDNSKELGTEGTLVSDLVEPNSSFGFTFTYGKRVVPKGSVSLIIPGDGGFYLVKSNSITSVSTNLTAKTATVFTKANITWIDSDCDPVCSLGIDGNVSVRLDVSDNDNTVGFTILSSKNSALYYSNDWYKSGKAWLTRPATAQGDFAYVTVQ